MEKKEPSPAPAEDMSEKEAERLSQVDVQMVGLNYVGAAGVDSQGKPYSFADVAAWHRTENPSNC